MPIGDAGLFGLHDDFISEALEILLVFLDKLKDFRFSFTVNVPFVFSEDSSVPRIL